MYTKNITQIEPPATLADLITLDATREVPYLKARCNRMGIHVPGPNPQPSEIIPYIERRLAAHMNHPARDCGPHSGDYIEWKDTHDTLHTFITYLNSLLPSFPSVKPQNPSSNKRHESEPKADQNRTASEPPSQPSATQQSQVNQKRTENEPTPNQNRCDSEPSAQNTSKLPENPTNDSPKIDLVALGQHIGKLDLTASAQYAIDQQILPNPDKVGLDKYGAAFCEFVGPPRAIRIEDLHPKIKYFILCLLEENSLKKVQDKLLLPPPFGPYIATSKSALRRFRIRQHAREAKRNERALRKQIAELKDQADSPDTDFPAVSEKLLKLRLVESSLNPDPDLTQTKTLIDMLEKIHAGKLAERKLQLAESKS